MKLRIGTRKSRLAMVQTEMVKQKLEECFPDLEIEVIPMSTKGDKILDRSLTSFGGKGVFTKELEEALLRNEIDLAVHSAKDMPMEFPKGLAMGAVLTRAEASDVLVTRSGIPARELPAGSVIGTSSLRRQIEIRSLNPQVFTKMLRGNVQTRLEKLRNGEYDGILLAAAGLERLELQNPEDLHLEYLDKELFIPAAGQGILALEIRDGELGEIMQAIHSPEAAIQLRAEREFLTILGGSCNAPCGAYCRKEDDKLVMTVMYARDGVHPVFRRGGVELPEIATSAEGLECGLEIAEKLADSLAIQVRFRPVYLVGAGPGDAGLFTRKGLECVRNADVIVYDNLISGSILNEARLDAELIYAGKRSGQHSMKQEEISQLLVQLAMTGKAVVRLKGGDPYIFGRGGEEALELTRHGIPFEIVPGISSSYSVPAYAGIPVTHRKLASSFHVITGHEGVGKAQESLNYEVLAKEEGTLVFLMGLRHLGEISRRLIEGGKPADTPSAVIQNGTTANQKVAFSDLAHIAEEAERCGIQTPAITVVGPVVGLEKKLSWFGSGRPLSGKRVLVTGTRYISQELEDELRPLGAETIAVSLIESRLLDNAQVRRALDNMGSYQWLVFTSSNGVDLFFEAMRRADRDLRCLMHLKFAAIGRKTESALKEHGFRCDFVPENFSGTDLAREWIPTLNGDERVLLMRAKEGSEVLPRKLKEAGIDFDDVPLYETWVDTRRKEELNRIIHQVDYVAVASSSAARALCNMLEEKEFDAKIISIGPYTTRTVREMGLPVYADAVEYTASGIASVILADTEEEHYAPVEKIKSDRVVKDSELYREAIRSREEQASDQETQAQKNADNAEDTNKQEGQESETPTAYFPLFFNLNGADVLIVGAGKIASRRASVLADFGAEVTVIAPEGCTAMRQLETEGKILWKHRPFTLSDLDGRKMALAITDDASLNMRIAKQGKEKGILVNNAGDKEQCDFYFPGIAREGSLVAGVTASGADHHLARTVTEKLKEWMETQKSEK